MSATATPNDSPLGTPIQPLHNPSQAAQVVVPQAPLGNVGNQVPGMGAKALLAKKFAKAHNPNFISPTDNLMTPVTQKLNAAKKKQFTKGAKPVQLFARKETIESNTDESDEEPSTNDAPTSEDQQPQKMDVDDENPF
ncbi:hypothetical protein P691DRAFT_723415 [Macrolepiota fuliginosa MF-IS2]|uniref:Uncharacterized protein n=1 Tax=Macrolepiota fuliginosa MF-IS2 TaxID=1400762 RepID=A0A9P5XHT5_9AGAR|nr:hypothetical protein P691DRAFT_723415 [Macrolepiota fuliginosa MF-IS2]